MTNAEWIDALAHCKLWDRSNPRPCKRCNTAQVYGNMSKRYCVKCKEEMHKEFVRASLRKHYHPCLECGTPVGKKSVRCNPCNSRYVGAMGGRPAA